MTLAISARRYEDGWLGFVSEGGRELSMCAAGYATEQDALRAAEAKRAEIQAERERRDAVIEARWQRGPAWQGSYLSCACGNEVLGPDANGLWHCDGFVYPETHYWRKTEMGWETAKP